MSEKKIEKEETFECGKEPDSVVLQHLIDLVDVNLEGLATDEETMQSIVDWLFMTGRLKRA